jgi:hypothetical protein
MKTILNRVSRQSMTEILDDIFDDTCGAQVLDENTFARRDGWGAQVLDENTFTRKDGWGAQVLDENTFTRKDGWGGRIRTHGWRDQNPLPYRLATPQYEETKRHKNSLRDLIKNTISRIKNLIVMAIFLFLLPVYADNEGSSNTKFKAELVLKHNNNQPINAIRHYRDGLLNSNRGQLFFNLDQINIINSNNDIAELNYLLVDSLDFYFASELGIFQNFRQIFSGEACEHIEKTSKFIFISCDNGIYKSEHDPKNKIQEFHWELITASPRQANYFSLNKSRTNINYAVSPLGFHVYNARKHEWNISNHGLRRNFQEDFKLGRYLITKNLDKQEILYLPSADGVMLSNDDGRTWVKHNSGIKNDPDGFYSIKEIIERDNFIFLISSTGLYYKAKESKREWLKLNISDIKKDSEANSNFHAIDSSKQGLFVASSQGEVFLIRPEETPANLKASIEESHSDVEEKTHQAKELFQLLSIEPKIQDLHLAVLRFAGIPTGKQFDAYRKQVRMRNLLPDVQTTTGRDLLRYIAIEERGSDSLKTNTGAFDTSFDHNDIRRTNNNVGLNLRLNWKLGNVIYDDRIHEINTNARITANIRENLLTEITQIYFRRKELLIKILEENIISLKSKIELDQLLAQLDARTGAWYSEELQKNLKKINLNHEIREFYYAS